MNKHIDDQTYKESVKIISNAVNKACKTGVFTIDEAYIIKIALATLEKVTLISENTNTQDIQKINTIIHKTSNYELDTNKLTN